MKKLNPCLYFFLVASIGAAYAQSLRPLSTFGPHGDGTLRPGDQTYLTVGGTGNPPHNRGLAYNPMTDHLLVVEKNIPEVHFIDSITGADIPGALDKSALAAGGNSNFPLNLIGVADDGSIYACNLSSATFPPQFRLYRWSNKDA